jgi:hypothetical protein
MPTSAIDSLIFRNMFGDSEIRQIWSDEYRTQCYLDWEAALARAQAGLGLIPKDAATEITRVCKVENIDFARLEEESLNIGKPVVLSTRSEICAVVTRAIGAIGELLLKISLTRPLFSRSAPLSTLSRRGWASPGRSAATRRTILSTTFAVSRWIRIGRWRTCSPSSRRSRRTSPETRCKH